MATTSTLLTKFQNMVDDVIDQDFALELLNDAKDEIESMQIWLQLQKETSYLVPQGNTYLTPLGPLPDRFANDISVIEENSNIYYVKIDFSDRISKKNDPLGYFFDLASNNFYLAGENQISRTIYMYYTEYSEDLDTSANDTWVFPARFHSILPYKMAEIYYAADAGEKGRAWDDRWSNQYERMLKRMMAWNDMLKVRNRRPNRRVNTGTPLSVNDRYGY